MPSGSVYLTSGTNANFKDNNFTNADPNGWANDLIRPRIGDILESRGDLMTTNNKIEVKSGMKLQDLFTTNQILAVHLA